MLLDYWWICFMLHEHKCLTSHCLILPEIPHWLHVQLLVPQHTGHFTLYLQQIIIYMLNPTKILAFQIFFLHKVWNTLYLAVLKREPKHLSQCGACLDMDTCSNKSQIPWELTELSPTQRSEMDGSHCMLLLQFIRQTVNMLGIIWAIISIWDSFKIKGTISTLHHNKCTKRLSRNYYSLNIFHFKHIYNSEPKCLRRAL